MISNILLALISYINYSIFYFTQKKATPKDGLNLFYALELLLYFMTPVKDRQHK